MPKVFFNGRHPDDASHCRGSGARGGPARLPHELLALNVGIPTFGAIVPRMATVEVLDTDITRLEVGIPAVRVIVPRSEAWTLYFSDGGRASLGPRALQQIR